MDAFLEQLAIITPLVEWLGMATGIVGVWLSIKEKIWAWPLFIVCYICYVYIGLSAGWFAFMGMNIGFIAISIYGWAKWNRANTGDADKTHISNTTTYHWRWIGLFLLVGTATVGYLAGSLDGARLPYLDAFAACCGFTAQWMLSRKHIETWFFWIAADVIYLGMFLTDNAWRSVVLFTVFIVLAIKGWCEWKAQLKQASDDNPDLEFRNSNP